LRAFGQSVMLGTGSGELAALLHVARCAPAARAPMRMLLDSQIPHVPGVGAMVPQHRLLGGRWKQPVPRHTNTLATSTDIPGEVKRRYLPGLKAGIFTPRSR
jgi:hypothetical protein